MSEPEAGWVDAEVADEFPELRLFELAVDARPGRTPRSVQERLRYLSSRFRGAQAVAQRQQPVPWAYRVFYRHVGLDPDADRTPAEAAMLDRLMHGGFKSDNLLDDALLVALVETGVPIWALDAAKVDGPLGVRVAEEGEHLGRGRGRAAGAGGPPGRGRRPLAARGAVRRARPRARRDRRHGVDAPVLGTGRGRTRDPC